MATKNLGRTVIEGGRVSHNKWDRRNSHKEQRAAERAYMSEVIKDPDNFDENMIEERDHVYKEFNDKLGPMYRWLKAQVDKPWAEVRSEIAQKFDTRTTAGRHITFDHLLSSVVDTLSGRDSNGMIAANQVSYSRRFNTYYVDDAGILRANRKRERYWRTYKATPEQLAEVAAWLQGRMVGEKGGVLYWFGPNDGLWKAEWSKEMEESKYGRREGPLALRYYSHVNGAFEANYYNKLFDCYEKTMRTGFHWEYIENPAGFKQRGPLTATEIKCFRSFPKGAQDEALEYGKKRI